MRKPRSLRSQPRALVSSLVMASLSFQAHAQVVDIANTPLATSATVTVRPNLMFILDDSGSMDWEYLPTNTSNVCFGYNGFNKVFYNPATQYLPPMKADGTSYADISDFTQVPNDGYAGSGLTNLNTVGNLSTPTVRVGTNTSGNAINSRFYYATPTNPAAVDCNSWSAWTYVTSASTWTAAERTNYANWYAYYRTRMFTMRAAVGRVMNNLDATRFRVGFSAISGTGLTSGSKFLPVSEFNVGTQKADFFTRLYGATPGGSTPLRPALEKIGKYYAKRTLKNETWPSGVADPVQYACQRNYAILTTDGYWNTGDEGDYRSRYKPTQLNGSTEIGNPDGASSVPRPLRDDGRTVSGSWVRGGAGVSNTLADIAMYFYSTDLRSGTTGSAACIGAISGQDVCDNIVKPTGVDTATHQHMTTFSLGLGVAGNLTYRSDYETASTGSFADLKSESTTLAWPDPQPTSTSSTLAARTDDLWHAAVNGRGRYYSASSPTDLITGLTDALDAITSVSGVGAAAATSTLEPVSGDNYVFVGEYTTVLWEGNLSAHTINPTTGAVSPTPLWQAKNTLKAQTAPASDTRTVFFRHPSTGANTAFTAANLTSAGLAGQFSNYCASGAYKLTQCNTLVTQDTAASTTARQTAINSLDNTVAYFRGQSQHENALANADVTKRVFRSRTNTPLGDVINAAPVYVKKPPFVYADTGYSAFVSANATRQAVVYVASNDGMLHAFNADTGQELWAYVPTMVMPKMVALADENYGTNHQYLTDGTPVVGDVFDGTSWRTIVVGGLNAGGRGYYALDVTNPSSPAPLWELTETQLPNLGLSYGNPVITKDKTGQWVVAFSSGYNNVSPGDGNGYVFVRNAVSGAAVRSIATNVSSGVAAGTIAAPSNLGKINAWVESDTDNTGKRIYGGDMKGYVWRVDFDDLIAPSGYEAMALARTLGPTGVAQPITTKPMLNEVSGTPAAPTVTVATGRLLGITDVGNTDVQSMYVFKDLLSTTGLGSLRANTGMVKRTMSSTTNSSGTEIGRTMSTADLDWSTKIGWYVDLDRTAGERVNVNMTQAGSLLGMAANTPTASACSPSGKSWLYTFDLVRGSMSEAMPVQAMIAGLNTLRLSDGRVHWFAVDTTLQFHVSGGNTLNNAANVLKRSSWRELSN